MGSSRIYRSGFILIIIGERVKARMMGLGLGEDRLE